MSQVGLARAGWKRNFRGRGVRARTVSWKYSIRQTTMFGALSSLLANRSHFFHDILLEFHRIFRNLVF